MKKHAYLLIAYHQFDLLKKLIGLLDDPHHDIFVHIDAKTQEFHPEDFNGIVKYSKLYFTDRTSVSWGGWSMIRCELLLLKQAKRTGEYAYYHLLSGQDLPLHPAGEIYRFFSEHEGKEFIHYIANPEGIDAKGRIAQYWLFQDRVVRLTPNSPYRASHCLLISLSMRTLKFVVLAIIVNSFLFYCT